MQVSVESLSGLQRRMTVQVPSERIESEVEQRLRRVGKTAKLKGFRPGKIPFKVVVQQYGGEIRREVVNELMQSSYAEAVQQEKLQPAGGPQIKSSKPVAGSDLEYVATFEIYPEIELKKVEGLKIERKAAEVAEVDIDRVVDSLRDQRAHWHVVERAAQEGDQVTIDYVGMRDGEAFEGNTASAVVVVVGSGQMPPEIEQALTGAIAGQQIEQSVDYPSDNAPANLAGRKIDFAITVNKVEQKHLPDMDEEFFKSFGVEDGITGLRNGVRDNMLAELEQTTKAALREQILNALIEHNPVDLPTSLVDQEVDYLRGDAAKRMGIEDPAKMPPAEPFLEAGRKRVALGLLVSKLVETAGLKADTAGVDLRLEALASQFSEPEQIMRAYRKDPRLMNQLEMAVVEEKAVDWLIERAKIKDVKSTFSEVMEPNG